MGAISDNKFAGLTLIAGPLLILCSAPFVPGVLLIDPVDELDLVGLTKSMADNAKLAHLTSMLTAFGSLLLLYGLTAIWRAIRVENAMDSLARLGILMAAFPHPASSLRWVSTT